MNVPFSGGCACSGGKPGTDHGFSINFTINMEDSILFDKEVKHAPTSSAGHRRYSLAYHPAW